MGDTDPRVYEQWYITESVENGRKTRTIERDSATGWSLTVVTSEDCEGGDGDCGEGQTVSRLIDHLGHEWVHHSDGWVSPPTDLRATYGLVP